MTAAAPSQRPTPFRTILVANRGEIALRILRTAHALGYGTVAVYSSADAEARHVRAADRAVLLGGPLPAQSYLDVDAIIAAAKATGADAIHPGYGFLAENASFARACREAGLVFVGPSPEAIAAMGDKAGAKRLMQAAGVPCVPGYQGDDQGDAAFVAAAQGIGFPVMIKASAGGGGRGMRLAASAGELPELLRSARSEAENAFGSAELILERAIAAPRHVEIQILADRHGNAIHLGERDCSVQRRHQKLIEETPSPAVDPSLRARMGEAAVAAALAIGYEGAGTLEFLLDRDGAFHFMEMNTRLQVEHPVTEAVANLDLVEMQFRIAAGEPLPLRQDEIRLDGHAIEVRLCAEDAARSFLPQSGRMLAWHMPEALRVEDALELGGEIPPFYDSMIAKLIAHGRSRDEARRKLVRGLRDAVALGVTTNQDFLIRCLEHPRFAAGEATTAFVGDHLAELTTPDDEVEARCHALAAVLLYETAAAGGPRRDDRRLAPALPLALRCEANGRIIEPRLTRTGPRTFEAVVGERRLACELVAIAGDTARFIVEGVMEKARFCRDGATLFLRHGDLSMTIVDLTLAAAARADDAARDGKVRASMSGRVVAVLVRLGEEVAVGAPLLTLEAMKMEHVHTAPATGKVVALHVAIGEQVAAHRLVCEIERRSAADDPGSAS